MGIFVFDAYGTLFDVHAAIARYRAEAGPDADRLSDIWRTKQLEYSWTLTLAGHYANFWTLTERALDYALARVPSVDKALKSRLLDAYYKLDAYADARDALTLLKAKGHKLGMLSNGSPGMLANAVDHAGLTGVLDAVISVDAAQDVQDRDRGLSAGDRPLQMHAGRRHLRVVKPLGRHGRQHRSAFAAIGSTAPGCRTNISTFRRSPHWVVCRNSRSWPDPTKFGSLRGLAEPPPRPYIGAYLSASARFIHDIDDFHQEPHKRYASGFEALKSINLDIRAGEIFALLGPNGAGKTTLIGIVCGILRSTSGSVTVGGHDIVADYRAARSLIGLVPQELHTDAFESVWDTVSFSAAACSACRAIPPISKRSSRTCRCGTRKTTRS